MNAAVDPLRLLGVTRSGDHVEFRVWSANAESMRLLLFDGPDAVTPSHTVHLHQAAANVWRAQNRLLTPGRYYALQASGPDGVEHHYDPSRMLLDPYGRAVHRAPDGSWRSVVVDGEFDWGDSQRPNTPLDHTVIYEAHVKGFTKRMPGIPEHLQGTYAGLAHDAAIAHLQRLGVTAIELLPVFTFETEGFLGGRELANYWGYNTLNFFSVHAPYASADAQAAGPEAVLREFKGMVRRLHEAGLEVILDVVYNHTAEEGRGGPTSSLRGIDNASYYRLTEDGDYENMSGTGNTVNFATPAAQRLVLDSLRYWANEMRIDGFRFDLATVLGRGADGSFDREHPLLQAIQHDPDLQGIKLIAEPWDVGLGGWQTGNFPDGWSEWNDRYRDRMRDFWLRDIAAARISGVAGSGIGRFATRFAGSANTFSEARGPLASINFITAHDGFTLHDLVSYNVKHNLLNGESNRDGASNNLSYNHGYEGPSKDEEILRVRRKAMRNLLGTLLLSAGVPMLTAGDEFGRSQGGNNNADCQDNDTTWLHWDLQPWQEDLLTTTQRLLQLRRENSALRPVRYARLGELVPSASRMSWYDGGGQAMSSEDWNSPENRTLQYVASSTPEFEEFNRILLIVHALEDDTIVRLPEHPSVESYELLWDSADERPSEVTHSLLPGRMVRVTGTSMQLYRAHGPDEATA